MGPGATVMFNDWGREKKEKNFLQVYYKRQLGKRRK